MATQTVKTKRLEIPYFDGVNTLVADNISKKQELSHAENARSKTIGTIEKREGLAILGNEITATANFGLFYFKSTTDTGFYRISTVGAVTSVYYLNGSSVWTALGGDGTGLTASQFDTTLAEDCCFFVNGKDKNMFIETDGTTVITSNSTGAHLYLSPKAYKINYYKGRLYVGNYYVGTTQYKNGVMRSSMPLGIVTLIDGDYTAEESVAGTWIKVTDTKYIDITSGNAYGIYRGSQSVASFTVDQKTQNSVRLASLSFSGYTDIGAPTTQFDISKPLPLEDTFKYTWDGTGTNPNISDFMEVGTLIYVDAEEFNAGNNNSFTVTGVGTDYFEVHNTSGVEESNKKIGTGRIGVAIDTLLSADEVWFSNPYAGDSYTGRRIFRWAGNPESGDDVKQYDTFKLTGGDNGELTMMENIGEVMMIANKNNLGVWNDYSLVNYDLGIGCVSDTGYIKSLGTLFFIHYTGIYATTGDMPKLISSKAQRYIDGATKTGLEESSAGRKGLSIFFAITGNITLYNPDGSTEKTISGVVLEYNMKQENWFIHEGINATQFATYPQSDDPDSLQMASTEDGYHVFEFLTGQTDNVVSSNKEIPFRADTANITLGKSFEQICYPMEVIIEAERGSGIKTFISLDGDPFYEIEGESIKGCTILKVTGKDGETNKPPRCRRIKLSIRDYTKKLCKISRVAIVYADSLEEENIKQDNKF